MNQGSSVPKKSLNITLWVKNVMFKREKKIMMSDRGIDRAFYDFHNYTVCRAVSEALGTEGAHKLFRRAGEIAFNELKKMIKIEETEQIPLLKRITKYLTVESGYMKKINITEISPTEIVIDMWGGPGKSSRRLIDEGYAPSHTMTDLMFAALKEVCGLQAGISHMEIDREGEEESETVEWGTGEHGREKWVLSKIEE